MDQGTIDWNGVWKAQWHEHQRSSKGTTDGGMWDTVEAARSFYRMALENNGERVRKTVNNLPLTPESRVLDVGAGPGAIAIPIARQVRHLTAVEPSAAMCSVFEENLAAEEGIGSVRIVQKRWEDVSVEGDLEPPYDIVFASYSLDLPDIGDAIRKMDAVSSGYVFVYWFAGTTSWDAMSMALWPRLHGSVFVPSPKCDLIYNLLYSMGIYPNIEVFPFRHINRFPDLDGAVQHFSPRYFAETAEQKEILREYLARYARPDGDTVIVPGTSTRVRIWWKKGDNGA
ncbi:class I SAM-dependent methyltransferase [Methanofollis fontis]|uniref:Class I SAM-dependent methyltransferase n=1 Tax=Methanofollis fontis TaxID=2052832 RepID=A0A483CVD0_9EURY|nr:class I SAM-dependent methyltransferase [Methanofollis fontis]TAJ45457.1 class I SAM-dependent methyltransferase [Methanofollis fontis]